MIVNNSTNINKTNNHVHPVILYLKSLNTIITRHTKLEIQVLASDRQNNVAWINRLMGSQLNRQCQKREKQTNKNPHRFASTQKDYILYIYYSIVSFFHFFYLAIHQVYHQGKKRKKITNILI